MTGGDEISAFARVRASPRWSALGRSTALGHAAAIGSPSMRRHPFGRPLVLWSTLSGLSAAIFVGDTLTDPEVAVSVLYVVVVLVSLVSERPHVVGRVGATCGVLTFASFLISGSGAFQPGLANCALSLVAIGATTFLAMRIEAAALARRQALADLAHMSRVTTVGELATSIAHEVSQPLAAIVANSNAALRWLSQSPAREDEARRAIDRVAKDADRAGAVISRVRHLMRRSPPSRDMVALNEAITDVATLLGDQLRQHQVMLRLVLAVELPPVEGDRVQLQQVVLNMMLNSIEAMVSLDPGERHLTVRSSRRGRHVCISVQDRGVGVAPEAESRIFEAFFTTKPAGMGVGLAISRSIVEAHGGTLDVGPHPPNGALFGFTLPVHAALRP